MSEIDEAIEVLRFRLMYGRNDDKKRLEIIINALTETKSKLAVDQQDNERYNTALTEMEHKKRWFEQQLGIAEQRLAKVGAFFSCSNERTPQGQMDWWTTGSTLIVGATFLEAIDNLEPVRKEEG